MNRLITRLLLAMLAISILSLAIVPIAQAIAARQTLQALAPDFRERVEEHTQPPPFPRVHPNPNTPDAASDNRDFLREETLRLFNLLKSYRDAQRRSILLGTISALFLGTVLAIWLSRSIARPIEAVSRAATGIAQGALNTRVSLAHSNSHPYETRALATNFNVMAESLEQLEGERKAMIADIAHELRNPLATLQFRLDALEDGILQFSQDELQLLKGQVGLLSRLINDLRTLSLADAGKLSLNLQHLDFSSLLDTLVRQYQDVASEQGLSLSYQTPESPLYIEGDADRLAQIVSNLLDNALKVTPEGGWIKLELKPDNDMLELRIRDSGPGIPEAELNTIFERFVQGKLRDTKGREGSGLGLAIVHTLVQLHKGSITAANHAEGAEFILRLPKA